MIVLVSRRDQFSLFGPLHVCLQPLPLSQPGEDEKELRWVVPSLGSEVDLRQPLTGIFEPQHKHRVSLVLFKDKCKKPALLHLRPAGGVSGETGWINTPLKRVPAVEKGDTSTQM